MPIRSSETAPETAGGRSALAGLRYHKKSLITLLIFLAYAGAVFWSHYDSMRKLQSDALIRFQLETEKQAAAIAYYFDERQNDIFELAESEPVFSFFKNRDLGMSYQYGLGVNVQLIEDRFEKVMGRKRLGDLAIYSRLVLVDEEGMQIASLGRANPNVSFEHWMSPGKHETRVQLSGEDGELIVSSPVWIDQRYYGELLAWTNVNTSLAQFGRSSSRWYSVLIDRQSDRPLESAESANDARPLASRLQQALRAGQGNINPRRASLLSPPGSDKIMAVARVDIGNTPLAFVSMTSDYLVAEKSSRWILLAAGGIPVLVLFLAYLGLRERRHLEQLSQRARIEAEHLAKARGDFLANMSHEIRTPMNAIVGMTELCLGTRLDVKQRNYLNKIQGASNALLRIINDILDFSRIESGKLAIEQLPFDLDQVLEDVGALLGESAAEKSIELVFDVDDSVRRTLIGDPLRLEQILINLIGNAIKFSDHGTITLRIRHEMLSEHQARVSFAVIDQGIGLSQEQQSRLFQAFSQADMTTTRRYGGTGLGLTICKRLVELMGGTIRVDSALGQGSTFQFHVHLEVDRQRVSSAAGMAQRLAPYADRPVLLVVGNPELQSAVISQLQQIGLASQALATVDEALETVFREQPVDYLAVMIDARVFDGEAGGVEAVTRLRNVWRGGVLPPFILLGSDGGAHPFEPAPGTFDRVLIKPTSPSRLFEEIAPLLGIKSRNKALPDTRDSEVLAALKGLEILLVDDVALNQEVVRDMLESAGMRVRLAANGSEAVSAVLRKIPDGILMDCQMPVMDGYEATRRIRQNESCRDLPIIALTANAMVTERQRCLEAGMNGYVAKPVKSRDLLVALSAHFPSRHRSSSDPSRPGVPESPVTAHPAEPGEARPLPELPGIDATIGLSYANGKPEIYRKILNLFRESHVHAFESGFRKALAGGDWGGAARIAHTLKGSARTIGAIPLGDAAQALEEACHVRQAHVEPLLDRLLSELALVSDGLDKVAIE